MSKAAKSGNPARILVGLILVSSLGALMAYAIPSISLKRQVMAGGGGQLERPSIRLKGTIGQPVVTTTGFNNGKIKIHSGFWQPGQVVSGVELPEDLPAREVGLQGAVPNPFNPMTEIQFEVGPEPAMVRLRVFDVSGRLIRTLVDGQLPAGSGKSVWRGRNQQGAAMPSGLYFVKLEVAGKGFTQKIMLLK